MAAQYPSRSKPKVALFCEDRGLSGLLWTGLRGSSLNEIQAVEPQIGTGEFGVKFEEMLPISPEHAGWIRGTNTSASAPVR